MQESLQTHQTSKVHRFLGDAWTTNCGLVNYRTVALSTTTVALRQLGSSLDYTGYAGYQAASHQCRLDFEYLHGPAQLVDIQA